MEPQNAAHNLAITVALQSFISAMTDPAQRATPPAIAIRKMLGDHAELERERLLAENARAIVQALAKQDSQALSRIHHSMSRHGFEVAAKQAIKELPKERLHAAAHWVLTWFREAKTRGEAASGFPAFSFSGCSPRI